MFLGIDFATFVKEQLVANWTQREVECYHHYSWYWHRHLLSMSNWMKVCLVLFNGAYPLKRSVTITTLVVDIGTIVDELHHLAVRSINPSIN